MRNEEWKSARQTVFCCVVVYYFVAYLVKVYMYFTSDRFWKYGGGIFRLLGLLLIAVFLTPSYQQIASSSLEEYWKSGRFLGHVYVGSIGAVVNVKVFSFPMNMALLLGGAVFCLWDVLRYDYATLIYLTKTFGGDYFASKLDTTEWKLALFFAFGVTLPVAWLLDTSDISSLQQYARIFIILFIVQLICEYGDNHFEQFVFFRHRYSFEIFNLLLLFGVQLSPHELLVLHVDLLACLFYRISNFIIILVKLDTLEMLSNLLKMIAFHIYGCVHGVRMVNVTDAEEAVAVLRSSDIKGLALEKHIATPAWEPIISLESVDGDIYHRMIANFHQVMEACPPTSQLTGIAKHHARALVESNIVIDAQQIALLTSKIFIEYVFNRSWDESFEIFAMASWEWRKEIAMRGKADKKIQYQAVDVLIKDLLPNCERLWKLYGDKWNQSEYYSLILQPFLISPCINVTDIMTAVKMISSGDMSMDTIMREMHPFPILERYVAKDVYHNGRLVVAANTQVIMFTSDFNKNNYPWPVFGSGKRSCAGMHLAIPLLQVLRSELSRSKLFKPEVNHRYSGRNNDNNMSILEFWYFANTVVYQLFFSRN